MARKKRVVKSTTSVGPGELANVPGNYYDKHGSTNPIVKRLMTRFHHELGSAALATAPQSLLDVGCGEGHTTKFLATTTGAHTVGVDLEDAVVAEATAEYPDLEFAVASAYDLPYSDDQFQLVVATEVLEHLDDPERAIKEMRRVAKQWCVFTVPNEPWWRIGNMMRGAYLTRLGNTPGHVQHWTKRGLARLLRPHFSEVVVTNALTWNVARCRL